MVKICPSCNGEGGEYIDDGDDRYWHDCYKCFTTGKVNEDE